MTPPAQHENTSIRVAYSLLGAGLGEGQGGGETRVCHVLRAAEIAGVEPYCLVTGGSEALLRREGINNVQLLRVPSSIRRSARERFRLTRVLSYFISIFALLTNTGPTDAQVFYSSSDSLPDAIAGAMFKRRHPGRKWVACVYLVYPRAGARHRAIQGSDVSGLGRFLSKSQQEISIRLIRSADAVFVLNGMERDILAERGIPSSSLRVVQPTLDFRDIDRPWPGMKSDAICIARLHPQKGIDDLVKVVAFLRGMNPNVHIIHVGGGSKAEVQRFGTSIKRNGLIRNLVTVGPKYGAAKFSLLRGSGVFLLPSRHESWGIVALEAMACALPVVAYDLPAFRLAFPTGMIRVPIGDAHAFALAANKLLADPQHREQIGREARKFAEGFDYREIARKEAAFLRRLVGIG